MNAIEIAVLTKSYGSARGIAQLNLTVGEGEFFGFIGPNGAGKSTTIRTLLGLLRADGGSARIFDRDIREEKREILSETGYLPSEAVFYPGMRARDVIKLSARLRGRERENVREAEKLCERLSLDVSKKVNELSFGSRKKLAIVCALCHKPRLCILDEPTGGLDPLMQREFFKILKERNSEGMTVFLSSHILSEIQRNCIRAAIIREGRIIACDSVNALARANAKRVHVRWRADISVLQNICDRDIRDIRRNEDDVSFLYGGDINALLRALSEQEIEDLSIAEPDLEEIFMHYYTDGGGENDDCKA